MLERLTSTDVRLEVRPSHDFAPAPAIQRILSLRTPTYACDRGVDYRTPDDVIIEDDDGGDNMRFFSSSASLIDLAARVNIDKEVSIGCAGAVMAYAQRLTALDNGVLPETAGGVRISSVEVLNLNTVMFINSDTICSLQIFQDETHPNFHSTATRAKEGLSLFGILNFTVTRFGHQLLKSWFLRPLFSIPRIVERQDAVALFMQHENLEIATTIKTCLKKVKNIPNILTNLEMGKATLAEWRAIMEFAYQCLRIRNGVSSLANMQDVRIAREIITTFAADQLRRVCDIIHDIIDFDMSRIENRIVVKPTVDDALDELKRQYDSIEDLLRQTARRVALPLTPLLPPPYNTSPLEVIDTAYVPQLGFLVKVTLNPVTNEPVVIHQDWQFRFQTEGHAFFKAPEVVTLDEMYGDLYAIICDREIEIVHEAQVEVLKFSNLMIACCRVTAELDCVLSFAEAAIVYKYTRPTITEDNVIEIHQGRHPLYELNVPSFVENDTHIRGDRPRRSDHDDDETPSLVLLTGANFSGKSVYLKQVALIVYMSHIGCYVPASPGTAIGLTDKLLTRVKTRESVARDSSAFMCDLQQISLALQILTARSLLVVDEFGKGTNVVDGAGLLGALLEHVLTDDTENEGDGEGRRQRRCKALMATHFHELFDGDGALTLGGKSGAAAFMHMRVMVDKVDSSNGITYLYKLVPLGPCFLLRVANSIQARTRSFLLVIWHPVHILSVFPVLLRY
ncbi:DNA mismatch repair protein MutS [Limtongia smithiae]|uniref:DNA mismatch repair protein MutS n=1 Tax=Limtongia smithiae TaxID=1125753 RepID=UPI0034CED982